MSRTLLPALLLALFSYSDTEAQIFRFGRRARTQPTCNSCSSNQAQATVQATPTTKITSAAINSTAHGISQPLPPVSDAQNYILTQPAAVDVPAPGPVETVNSTSTVPYHSVLAQEPAVETIYSSEPIYYPSSVIQPVQHDHVISSSTIASPSSDLNQGTIISTETFATNVVTEPSATSVAPTAAVVPEAGEIPAQPDWEPEVVTPDATEVVTPDATAPGESPLSGDNAAPLKSVIEN